MCQRRLIFSSACCSQEQLDKFAAERNALLNEKGSTQAELNKLADAYANLMGHQNQRQKIKHMVKLKEENFELKQVRLMFLCVYIAVVFIAQIIFPRCIADSFCLVLQEVSKLRAHVGKQKQELDRLKSDQTPRRFDPSKAFKHEHKENQQPTSALTQGENTFTFLKS